MLHTGTSCSTILIPKYILVYVPVFLLDVAVIGLLKAARYCIFT